MRSPRVLLSGVYKGHYVELINALSGIMDGESDYEGQKRFSQASNDIQLFAPKEVINAFHQFRNHIHTSNKNIEDGHDEKLTKLLFAIRKDLKISPKDKKGDWQAKLWSIGQSNSQ